MCETRRVGKPDTANQNHDHHDQVLDLSTDVLPQGDFQQFDYDDRLKRIGTVLTSSARIITAVTGVQVLSMAWDAALLGWIAALAVMFLFSSLTFYTSVLLTDCYRSGDPIAGRRNYTHMDAVRSNLGGHWVKVCRLILYLNHFGVVIGYTITASTSMTAIKRSNCFHASGGKNPCNISSIPFMIAFGVVEIILSQIPRFDEICWLPLLNALMSFAYSSIGLALGIAKIAETGEFRGSLMGIRIGTVTQTQKIWRSSQALGDVVFAYSYSVILIEIQDTIKSPPSEAKTMKKATGLSVTAITLFYLLYGCIGYAAFGDQAPRNLLTGFGFYNPFWLLDIANAAMVIHLVGEYQVHTQPLFAFIEKKALERFPESNFTTKEIKIPILGFRTYNLNLFRLVWRTFFVIITTTISMILPFFNDVLGLLGAFGFWPLTVYFPVKMYIAQKMIPKWSTKWLCLQMLSVACLIVSIAAAAGSIAGLVLDLKVYKPFDLKSNAIPK